MSRCRDVSNNFVDGRFWNFALAAGPLLLLIQQQIWCCPQLYRPIPISLYRCFCCLPLTFLDPSSFTLWGLEGLYSHSSSYRLTSPCSRFAPPSVLQPTTKYSSPQTSLSLSVGKSEKMDPYRSNNIFTLSDSNFGASTSSSTTTIPSRYLTPSEQAYAEESLRTDGTLNLAVIPNVVDFGVSTNVEGSAATLAQSQEEGPPRKRTRGKGKKVASSPRKEKANMMEGIEVKEGDAMEVAGNDESGVSMPLLNEKGKPLKSTSAFFSITLCLRTQAEGRYMQYDLVFNADISNLPERATQNRESQRAFRERKEIYLR